MGQGFKLPEESAFLGQDDTRSVERRLADLEEDVMHLTVAVTEIATALLDAVRSEARPIPVSGMN